jgi:hypothetical protein
MTATAIGLAVYVVIGALSWAAVRGLHGIGLCGALGAAAGAALSGPGSRLARFLGGGIGGAVAGYFTLASGEVFPPGSMQWALSGGAYGALFGLPVAALVGGLIGLIGAVSRSLRISDGTTDKGRPTDRVSIRALLLVIAVLSLFLAIAHHRDRQWRLDRAILAAAHGGDAAAVRSLLDRGADVNAVEGGPSFWTPLMHVALQGDVELVRLLLDRGADVNRQDGDGFTALTVAAAEGHWEVVMLLALRGAAIDHRDATLSCGHSRTSREIGVSGLHVSQAGRRGFESHRPLRLTTKSPIRLHPGLHQTRDPSLQYLRKKRRRLASLPCPYSR